MGTLYLATSRHVRNPVRPQHWDASVRAGDDFKLALTVFADDVGTPASVDGAVARMLLWPDLPDEPYSADYGLGWLTGGAPISRPGWAVRIIVGFPTPMRAGGINFAVGGTDTGGLCGGRYRMVLQVDLPDGGYSQVEGVLQVRSTWGYGLTLGAPPIFQLDVSPLDQAALAAGVVNGLPVDVDGFFLSNIVGAVSSGGNGNAGQGGSTGGGSTGGGSTGGGNSTPGASATTAVLGVAVLGNMVLGAS